MCSPRYKIDPPRIELDQQADQGEEWEHQQQTETGKNDIETALHHQSCPELDFIHLMNEQHQ
jgi:hypothetical protein